MVWNHTGSRVGHDGIIPTDRGNGGGELKVLVSFPINPGCTLHIYQDGPNDPEPWGVKMLIATLNLYLEALTKHRNRKEQKEIAACAAIAFAAEMKTMEERR